MNSLAYVSIWEEDDRYLVRFHGIGPEPAFGDLLDALYAEVPVKGWDYQTHRQIVLLSEKESLLRFCKTRFGANIVLRNHHRRNRR